MLVVAEMKSRNIPIPEDLELPLSSGEISWNADENGYFPRKDGIKFRPRPVLVDFINDDSRFILLKSGRGGGKALSLDTDIPTPLGFTKMGDIQVGDTVYSADGTPTAVTFVSDVMYGNDCYSVTFDDGSNIIADGEHLWEVMDAKNRKQCARGGGWGYITTTTNTIRENLIYGKRGDINFSVDLAKPICGDASLPVHPYALGYWLGDGTSRSSQLTIGDEDAVEATKLLYDCGFEVRKLSTKYAYRMEFIGLGNVATGRGKFVSTGGVYSCLKSLGVIRNKHIPNIYLRASYESRLAVLQGLMDTDGSIDPRRGKVEYCTSSYRMAMDFLELCSTLAIKVSLRKGTVKFNGAEFVRYRFSFTPHIPVFRFQRKSQFIRPAGKQSIRGSRRYILSVEKVKSVPVRCIQVDHPSHLYLVGRTFIPTHNTVAGCQKALKKIMEGKSGAVMNPDFENFRTSTWPELQQWIPWHMVVPKHRYRSSTSYEPIRPFTIVFMNGAKMYCKGLKDPESARGANLNWFWYDEGRRDPTGLGWKNAVAFLRVGEKPQAWCTTTMASLDHWTNTFFQGEVSGELKKIIEELKSQDGFEQNLFATYKTSPKENVENLDPLFYASLISTYSTGYLRLREVDGEAADEGGSLGTREWFENKELPEIPDWAVKFTRFWDLAGTEKKILKGKKLNDPDETVGTLLGTDKEKDLATKKYAVCDQAGGYLAWKQLKEFIVDVTRRDIERLGMVTVCFEQEPASGGKNQVAELKEFIEVELKKRYGITLKQYKLDSLLARDLGDRVLAANTWFSEANNGQFYYVRGLWNSPFFGQLDTFDGIRHDDRITSVTGARHHIAPLQKKFGKMDFLHL